MTRRSSEIRKPAQRPEVRTLAQRRIEAERAEATARRAKGRARRPKT